MPDALTTVSIRGIDPLLFRDPRPFSADAGGSSARTLPIPAPSTVAGFLRTRIGANRGWDWAADGPEMARSVSVSGPILVCNGTPILSAPKDALILDGDALRLIALRPVDQVIGGTDLPDGMLPLRIAEEGKPATGYGLWDWETVMNWLAIPDGTGSAVPASIAPMEREERVHVAICGEKGVATDGKLFSAQFLSFEKHRWGAQATHQDWGMLARVEASDNEVGGVGTLGGERRLAAVEAGATWPECPVGVRDVLRGAKRVRMTLVTPALFSEGWRPGWDGDGPAGCERAGLRLVGAAVGRREPLSGWDFETRKPRALRSLAPAGSTYFFDVADGGDPSVLADAGWLAPTSDDAQDRRDGFGLAVWGVW